MTEHAFDFDPSYGYDLDALLRVGAPPPPEDFASFWQARYARALAVSPRPRISDTGTMLDGHLRVFDLEYTSTGGVTIGGWLLRPVRGEVTRGFVMGHGYGGRDAPEAPLPDPHAVTLLPCLRGIGRSRLHGVPEHDLKHVLHGIDSRESYIHGGCVEDLWLAVSALLELFPEVSGHVGYLGGSFCGGLGALALPWDERIKRGFLEVPSFGNQPLRLELPTNGSGKAVSAYVAQHPEVANAVLPYYDAATAARFIRVPMLCACAQFDPAVAPPGQFAVYNAIRNDKKLFVLPYGHFEHPDAAQVSIRLHADKTVFFTNL
jgi:cephalosporin-C deacetylase